MYQLKVSTRGFNEAAKKFENNSTELAERLKSGVKTAGNLLLNDLKFTTPQRTGNLLSSMESKVSADGLSVEVGPDLRKAPYAPYVERGHHTRSGGFVPGQFFLRKTVARMTPLIKHLFVKLLD
jgi:HK97 gp10 family phage protein